MSRCRPRRLPRAAVVLLLAVLVPQTAHAQFGSLKKKILGKKDPAPAQSGGQPVVRMETVVITPELVDAYLKGLAARDAEMKAMARENTPVGRYYAALVKHDELVRRHNDFNGGIGPDYQRHEALMAQARKGDAAAARQADAIVESLSESNAPAPSAEDIPWTTQREANDRLDAAMRRAAGVGDAISPGAWLGIVDRLPWAATRLADDPNVPADQLSGSWSASEIAAVRARRIDLARAMGTRYRTDEQLAAAKAAKAEEARQKQQEQAQESCMEQAMPQAEQDKFQAEMEAAQKAGDTAKMTQLGQVFATRMQAAMAKCQGQ